MSFFVTSAGSGKGADLGGLDGAAAICQKLATAAGAGGKTWRAYLSVPGTFRSQANPQGEASVNARDRIGTGPLPENWAWSRNFPHPSVGCSQEALVRTGGAGRFYCFAVN